MPVSDGSSSRSTFTIGAVVAALVDDFPDLSISKVRFLESKGLLTPERRPSGYRVFSQEDVERLRYILTAQRDRFWPLEVIRDALDAIDRGLTPSGPGESTLPTVPETVAADAVDSLLTAPASSLRLTEREVRRSAGIDEATLTGLLTYGLLRPDRHGHFDEDDLAVARAAGQLASHGIEPRHLRPFRTAADRELALVEQVRGPAARRRDDDPAVDILRSCLSLHAALVRGGLGD
ncbi:MULTISPECIES: transcriptional regulator FtsR [Arsenicicoccus]|jgi:DNA-binding transcriptional MerR regulator|uniref:MerR family transcriptional regulator n=1 Tax=Arsenicicoccus bolidensis TaxID=229480 RepID=A0ABS9PZF8_9MICO|nr:MULTISPECIES: MerR family transcriptional regulator [Arsenicicoccus]MCG7321021.1 MerR family transcriptional regulator [Arsenicicoccus bolidensis]